MGQTFLSACFLLLTLLAGCAFRRGEVEQNLLTDKGTTAEKVAVAEVYRVSCPDVLEVHVAHRPHLSYRVDIGPDGRLPVRELGTPRVEGRTLEEAALQIAQNIGASPQDVALRVAEYNSQMVYLFGQVKGSHRSVTYRGPETVLELLQRVGGITAGAEPADVYVIRSHIAEDKRPEVFHVDLRAIVMDKDHSTNIRLLPYDQVHVGETRKSRFERCLPRWLRPFFQAVWDTRPANKPHKTILGKRLHDVRRKW